MNFHPKMVGLCLTLGIAFSALCLTGCIKEDVDSVPTAKSLDKPQIYTTNYPLTYFAQRIGGSAVDVHFIVDGDVDPAFWKPSDAQIAQLQAADLILCNGATYEKWREHVSLPDSIVFETAAGFSDQFIVTEGKFKHTHGKEGDHSHDGTAFTTWIDFKQAKLQAKGVRDALLDLAPGAEDSILEAEAALQTDLAKLEGTMELLAERLAEKPLFASHPVYQYFARAYGLSIESVLWEPETVPDEDSLTGLAHTRDFHAAKWMIWEGEPAAESVAKLDEMGIRSVVFDPCGNTPDSGDWLSVMQQNLVNLEPLTH